MAIDRRVFLKLGAALALSPVQWAHGQRLVSGYLACRRRQGRDACVRLDEHGNVVAWFALPRRGHSFAIDSQRQRAVVFGRQPGFFAYGFSLREKGELVAQRLPLPSDRHFYGHGVFSPDGAVLYATENDFSRARGVIGVYDARPGHGYRRMGEFETGGIGPHELLLMPDGNTLCVANGGLETHPDYGKTILNLSTMQASLAYLDGRDGRLLESHTLPATWRQLSIRHLSLDGEGRVWAGCQYASQDGRRPELVWRHRRGQPLEPVICPSAHLRAMRNYVGSVATSADGTMVATSSPLGGRVLFWQADNATLLGVAALPDVCGVAPAGAAGFLLSSGHGVLIRHDARIHSRCENPNDAQACPVPERAVPGVDPRDLSWDNHMRRI